MKIRLDCSAETVGNITSVSRHVLPADPHFTPQLGVPRQPAPQRPPHHAPRPGPEQEVQSDKRSEAGRE